MTKKRRVEYNTRIDSDISSDEDGDDAAPPRRPQTIVAQNAPSVQQERVDSDSDSDSNDAAPPRRKLSMKDGTKAGLVQLQEYQDTISRNQKKQEALDTYRSTDILTTSWRLGHTMGRQQATSTDLSNGTPSRYLLGYPIFADIVFGYVSTYTLEEEYDTNDKSHLLQKLENNIDAFNGNGARFSMFVIRTMGWMLGKVWRRLFSTVDVNETNILHARDVALEKPLVLLPSHKSHVDYLMMSYICFAYNLPIPIICAGENLNILGIGAMLRYAGCFFMKRSFRSVGMIQYRMACEKYVSGLLSLSTCKGKTYNNNNSMLEFFIEGGRSRHGKLIKPRVGMLKMVIDSKYDCTFMPVALSYDMIPEMDDYIEQLLGKPKSPESLSSVLKIGYRLFIQKMMMIDNKSSRYNCGNAYIRFAPSISMLEIVDKYDGDVIEIAHFLQRQVALASIIPDTALVATVILMERFLHGDCASNDDTDISFVHRTRQIIRVKLCDILKKVLVLKNILVQIGAHLPNNSDLNGMDGLKKILTCLGYTNVKYSRNNNDSDASSCWNYIDLPNTPHLFLKLAYLRNQLIHFFTGMYTGVDREIIFNEYQYGIMEQISVEPHQKSYLNKLLKSFIIPYREAYAATISLLPLSDSSMNENSSSGNSSCKTYTKLAQDLIQLKLYAGSIKCYEALSLDTLKSCYKWFLDLDLKKKIRVERMLSRII